MQAIEQYFNEVDDSLWAVREGIETYSKQVDSLDVIYNEIMVYVEKSNDQHEFLTELSNALITQLESNRDLITAKDLEIKRLTEEIAQSKLYLQNLDERLNEASMNTQDLRPALEAATRDRNAAESQLNALRNENAVSLAQARRAHDIELNNMQSLVAKRTKLQRNEMLGLEKHLAFSTSKLSALQKQMNDTRKTAQRLQSERDMQASALQERMEQLAQSGTGLDELSRDRAELGTILQATGRATNNP